MVTRRTTCGIMAVNKHYIRCHILNCLEVELNYANISAASCTALIRDVSQDFAVPCTVGVAYGYHAERYA